MTMQRCRRVWKEQKSPTTKGFSAKVRMSRSTNACSTWFRSSRFCLLIFFMAKRCRVATWRTRYTVLGTGDIIETPWDTMGHPRAIPALVRGHVADEVHGAGDSMGTS
ncbi:hypothetical protein AV530_016365 [Patagioenas fasciata monilis]|uniref:Uncharacterized protein n=1 Tax=Patagioenas fasciata monilis TaxID=372326 RepID=A0A1V4KWH7_PATFA|nr:hypothetical protein AV530_016365 [Patagioenas fasciata monilis]